MTAKLPLPSAHISALFLPLVITVAGIALIFWVLSFTQNGVLFNGDSGLKALATQQVAQQLQYASAWFRLELLGPVAAVS